MREIISEIEQWLAGGKQVALATVVKVYGSAPRPLGSKMAVSSAGDMVGSVSAGCVEGNVFQHAQEVLKTGKPKLMEYGITDEMAFEAVGLLCGGNIDVYIEPLDAAIFSGLKDALAAQKLFSLATVLGGAHAGGRMLVFPDGHTVGDLGALAEPVRDAAIEQMKTQHTVRQTFNTAAGPADVFIEIYPPPQRLIVIGAVHIAMVLATFGKALGFRTIVIDPRDVFASKDRFPQVDELIVQFPADALAEMQLDEGCYLVFVSHNAEFDNPALKIALNRPVRYIGALGSRRTHAKRVESLTEMGLSAAQIARIHAPIGLDLGAIGPEEIALSIIAEIIAVKRGKAD